MGAIFAEDMCQFNFFLENQCILIQIYLKFVPRGPICHKPKLIQIMAWCETGDKALFESTKA